MSRTKGLEETQEKEIKWPVEKWNPTLVSSHRIRSSGLRTWHASPPCGMWHRDSKGVRRWVVRNRLLP